MKFFNILHLNKHKHLKQSDGSRLIKRRIIAALCFILICGLFMGITAIAMYAGNATSGNNVVRSVSYRQSITFGNIVTNQVVQMGSDYSVTASDLSVASYSVTISAQGQTVNGFCAITVTDNGDSPTRTRALRTVNIPAGESVTLTFNVVNTENAIITFHPHWGLASNSTYSAYTEITAGSSTDVGVSGEAATFTHSDNLAHTDTYLYRVGNGNAVTLGTLFKAATGTPNAANVKIKVESLADAGTTTAANASVTGTGTNLESGSNAQCIYTKSGSDWTASTLKFTGEGPVKVTISEGGGGTYPLNLEVVNGNNFIENATLSGKDNIVLLGNVKLGASSARNPALTLSGQKLWGNGFSIDCTGNNISSKAFGIISLTDSAIDNAVVNGPKYTEYGGNYGDDYYAATIVCYDNSVITNSRITNAKDPCCIYGTNVEISDTILSGGLFANMQIRNRGGVTVNNLTTVNTQNGLGIVFYLATSDSYITINGDFTQHNFVADNATMSNESADKLKETMFSSTYSMYQFTSGSRKYVNTGIISMDEGIGMANITDNRDDDIKQYYSGMTATISAGFISANGYVYTMKNTYSSMFETSYTEPAYTPSVQLPYPPVFSWSVPSGDNVAAGGDAHCYKDGSGVLQIQFLQGGSKTINASNYATFKKYGATTAITPSSITCVKNASGASLTVTNGSVTFTDAGEYTITYQYNGVTVYDKDLKTPTTVDYTKTIKVNVAVKQNRPNATITSSSDTGTIAWGKAGSLFDPDYNPCSPVLDGMNITDYDANGNPYTVLSSSNTDQKDFISRISNVSVSGKTATITLANGTKLVIVCSGTINGSAQIKTQNNKLYFCDSTAHNNKDSTTMDFTSYTYTGENGVAVSYSTKRRFTGSSGGSTIGNYSDMTTSWTSNKFLMYDAQGGTVSPAYTGTSPATLPTPTREGYTFLNWNKKADGTGEAKAAGASYSFSSTTTLYAIWEKNVTVSFSSSGSIVATISAGYGTTRTLPTDTDELNWLEGWYTEESGGNKIGNPGASFTVPTEDTTYYAHWSPKYYVIYNTDGGTVSAQSVTDPSTGQTVYGAIYEGTAITLPTTATKSGFTFDGWYTAASGGTKVTGPYTPTDNTILYAHWKTNWVVTYNANGGSVNPASAEYTYSGALTLPTPTNGYKMFEGWYTSGGTKINSPYTPTADITLYAHWSDNILVTFEGNGGSVDPASAAYDHVTAITLPTPTWAGHRFNGWYTAASGGTKVGNAGASYVPTEPTTLHAQWTAYTVSYDGNGADNPPSAPAGENGSVKLPTPTLTGYTFNGWFTAASGGDKVGDAGASYTPTANITLYAQWTQQKFTVSISADTGGSVSHTSIANVPYGTPISVSSNTLTINGTEVEATAKSNYTFDKWSVSNGATVTSAMTITASFKSSGGGTCITEGTLITLADGTQKAIEELDGTERILAWDFENGRFVETGIVAVILHGYDEFSTVDLHFSNGTTTRVVGVHSFFDVDERQFVRISADNVEAYMNHQFMIIDENGNRDYAVLTSAETGFNRVYSYSILSEKYINVFANSMLTLSPSAHFLCPYDIDENMRIDEEAKRADLERYGIMTYEEFVSFAPGVSREQFDALGGPCVKVAIGKGVATVYEIMEYASIFLADSI